MKIATFKTFKTIIEAHLNKMFKENENLFTVAVDKDEMWENYLNAFPAGTNEIYRKRREYDCSCCRQFVKKVGNVVAINNGEVQSIWDVNLDGTQFEPVVKAMSKMIHEADIDGVFCSKESVAGANFNFDTTDANNPIRFEHFYCSIPGRFVKSSPGEYIGSCVTAKNVFQRSLSELSTDSVETVLELIAQNSLYRGNEWTGILNTFLSNKKAFDKLTTSKEKNLYAWENSVKLGDSITHIRNHAIGTLLIDISNGVDLNTAVTSYERITAPTNYKRPKAIFTKKMLEDAQNTVNAMGYAESMARRFATLGDISVNNLLFCNRSNAVKNANDIFAEMAKDAKTGNKHFDRVAEIGIKDFVDKVLPTARSVEAYIENKHQKNFMSLITAENEDSKSMFKWGNNFSWAYTGNITDSDIRTNVKNAGGNVNGVLRFSIQWNDDEYNPNDFDAHCKFKSNHIYFANKKARFGALDVDIVDPIHGVPAVENIVFTSVDRGNYEFYVHCYSNNSGCSGFKAEIEFEGRTYSFNYPHNLHTGEKVKVADVMFDGTGFSIHNEMEHTVTSKDIWGVKTENFVPVVAIMNSPNYWDENTGCGNKHYFFMLEHCVNNERPSGIFNEYLTNELSKHKHVFEALGAKMRVDDTDNQLSGVGFCDTKRNSLIVKVKGNTERVMKIVF